MVLDFADLLLEALDRRASDLHLTARARPRRALVEVALFAAPADAARHVEASLASRLLLIAACAQQHGADVIHVDRHFDALAKVLRFRSVRLDAR